MKDLYPARILLQILFFCLAICDCHPQSEPSPSPAPTWSEDAFPPPTPYVTDDAAAPDASEPSDAGPIPSPPPNLCDIADEHIKKLGCTVRKPRTGEWVDACRNALNNGIAYHFACINTAKTCTAISACLSSGR